MNTSSEKSGDIKPPGQALGLSLPPKQELVAACLEKASEPTMHPDHFADLATQDPVIPIEIFRQANSVSLGAARQPVTSLQAAVTRLGSSSLQDALNELDRRSLPPEVEAETITWFELQRERSRRIGAVARMFGELFARTSLGECQLAGLFCGVGELLAILHLGNAYTKLATKHSRAALMYKLVQDFRFDTDNLGPQYLLRQGVPQTLVVLNEAELASKDRKRAAIKPLVHAALEVVDAFEKGRGERLAPGKQLPAKSNIRLLQFQGDQYDRLYGRITEFFFNCSQETESPG